MSIEERLFIDEAREMAAQRATSLERTKQQAKADHKRRA